MTQDSLFQMTSMASMKRVFEINFFAQMQITQFASKMMSRQQSGSIIFVSWPRRSTAIPANSHTAPRKRLCFGATRTLATELAQHNIRVNAIAPGVIRTDMTASPSVQAYEKLAAHIPMHRAGQPSEIAAVMLFLASDLSSYVTGQVLRIDGGIG